MTAIYELYKISKINRGLSIKKQVPLIRLKYRQIF